MAILKTAIAPLNTLVVKRSDFSYNDIDKLKEVKKNIEDAKRFGPVDTKIVFVSSNGETESVKTNGRLFYYITEGDPSCLIYGKMVSYWECGDCKEHYPYSNVNKHRLLIDDNGFKTHGWLCGNCAEQHYGIEDNA